MIHGRYSVPAPRLNGETDAEYSARMIKADWISLLIGLITFSPLILGLIAHALGQT